MREEVLKDIERVLSSSKEPVSLKQLMDTTNISYYVLVRHLDYLVSSGKVEVVRIKRRKKYIWVGEQTNTDKKKQDKKTKVKDVKKDIETKKECKSDGNQLKITRNVMTLLQNFIRKYGIEDLNVAINYLLLRGVLIELKLSEIKNISATEVCDELIEFKRLIKKSYISKLATQRIERLQKENKAQEEALSKYLN